MNILILGGTGYLGKKIINNLISNNHFVICLKRENSDLKYLNINDPKLVFWDLKNLKNILKENTINIDCMINTSCKYLKNNVEENEILEANLFVPLSVFYECINYGVKRFITIGTGLPDNFNLYSFSKREFANFGKWYSEKFNEMNQSIIFCNIELQNFYGIDEPVNRFIPNTIQKLKTNQPILLTEGTQRRDFIYIDDVVNAIGRIVQIEELPNYFDLPLGSGEGPTVREVIEYLHNISKSKSELRFGAIPKRNDEPDSVANLTVLNLLGIEINYNWKDGMRKFFSEQSDL